MSFNKLLTWRSTTWKDRLLSLIIYLIIFLILNRIVFLIPPTQEGVERYFTIHREVNVLWCNPHATEFDDNDEHGCVYNLRRSSSLVFGRVINAGFPLFIFTPFGYFNYDQPNGDFHVYTLVVTRDEGPLVYSPVNGELIGTYEELMKKMGCEVSPYEKPFFPIEPQKNELEIEMFKCTHNIQKEKLETMKELLS